MLNFTPLKATKMHSLCIANTSSKALRPSHTLTQKYIRKALDILTVTLKLTLVCKKKNIYSNYQATNKYTDETYVVCLDQLNPQIMSTNLSTSFMHRRTTTSLLSLRSWSRGAFGVNQVGYKGLWVEGQRIGTPSLPATSTSCWAICTLNLRATALRPL